MGAGSFLTAVVVTNRDRFITNWRDFRYYKLRKRLLQIVASLIVTNRGMVIAKRRSYYKPEQNYKSGQLLQIYAQQKGNIKIRNNSLEQSTIK